MSRSTQFLGLRLPGLLRRGTAAADFAVSSPPANLTAGAANRQHAIREMADGIDGLAFKVCDVGGDIDEVSERFANASTEFEHMRSEAATIDAANQRIELACDSAARAAADSSRDIERSIPEARAALDGIQEVITGAQAFDQRFDQLTNTLARVAAVTLKVAEVAHQTKVLSLNAAIEAAGAGDSGVGFGVVASEVKQLAAQTGEATADIRQTIGMLTAEVASLREQSKENAQRADASRTDAEAILNTFTRLDSAVRSINDEVGAIKVLAADNLRLGSEVIEQIESRVQDVNESSQALGRAAERTAALMGESQALIAMIAEGEIESADTRIIQATVHAAMTVSQRFEQALASGEISEDALFDEDYLPVEGTDPQQYMTRFVTLTDRLLPDLLQAQLEVDQRVIFSAAVDRNGFLPTHNEHLSHPQGPDPVWNDIHCRQMRFFRDAVTSVAASNTRPILMQTHRRLMEDGSRALVKDLAVPITCADRHWGALRCGFHLAR